VNALRATLPRVAFIAAPAFTLAAGVTQTTLARGGGLPDSLIVRVALLAVMGAPVLASLALMLVDFRVDVPLIASAAMLTSIGTCSLFALSLAPGPNQSFFASALTRHGLFIGAGYLAMVVGMLLARRVDRISHYPYVMLVAALALVSVTGFVGETVNGARLWLALGPLRFQPAEVARPLLIGFFALYLYERRHLVASPWMVGSLDLPPAPYLFPLGAAVAMAALILAAQNDLGMAALIMLGAGMAVASALQSRTSTILGVAVLTVSAGGAFLTVSRVRDRVTGWLAPWQQPTGAGFQFVQADYSLASGGIAGAGRGVSAAHVPEVHTDFVLIGIANQFGFLVAVATLTLTCLVILRSFLVSMRAASGLDAFMAASLAMLLSVQVLLIVGGSLRVLPLTGLTLPLVSYGGTSLVVTLFSLGLIVGFGTKPISFSAGAESQVR
jgi:cell division protein FtsW (lipid II flippase)